jgi:glucosamine--fructose-6-phosphate aminotransferase (isomerizing)
MCGIIGYIGSRQASPILLDGLRRLEYRGYDSAGMALQNGNGMEVLRRAGRIDNLKQLVNERNPQSLAGISHTRWATHGPPTDKNAHPHRDQSGNLAIVHNGVIENYQSLRDTLKADGHVFNSDTDTEVLAHLIGHFYELEDADTPAAKLVGAMQDALAKVRELMESRPFTRTARMSSLVRGSAVRWWSASGKMSTFSRVTCPPSSRTRRT